MNIKKKNYNTIKLINLFEKDYLLICIEQTYVVSWFLTIFFYCTHKTSLHLCNLTITL